MDEEKQKETEGKKPEEDTTKKSAQGKDDSADGVSTEKEETITELDRADQIAERQARENDRREKILDREETLAARRAVGGTTEAGQTETPKFSKEEKASRARIKAVADASGSSWGKNYE